MHSVLLIDDDEELCTMLKRYLGREGFEVGAVQTGDDGLKQLLSSTYELVLLDIMLPGIDGLEILRALRKRNDVPVLMLTARGEEVDRIVGLEVGADDYLPKPFNPRELLARMRAVLRRRRANADTAERLSEPLRVGDLELDVRARTVLRQGQPIELTTTEFDLLTILLKSAGQIVSRDSLAEIGMGRSLAALDRSVDMHISKLRRKLGTMPGGEPRIRTVRNVGYLYTLSKR